MAEEKPTEVAAQYNALADWFDNQRTKKLMERGYLDALTADLPAGAAILDIGCGTAEPIASHLIAQGFAVTGIDIAPAMIQFCRSRFPDSDWQVADMRKISLGRQFQALIAWHSFFHLTADDQRAMFPVFAAHAAPGARLLFTSGPGEGIAYGEMNNHSIHHASLSADEYESLLQENGFDVILHKVNDADCGNITAWLAQKK